MRWPKEKGPVKKTGGGGDDDDADVVAAGKFFQLYTESPIDQRRLPALLESVKRVRQMLAGNAYCRAKSDAHLLAIVNRLTYACDKCSHFGTNTVVLEFCAYAHSCDPSASIVSRGDDGFFYLVANRRIASDADIRIAYVSNLLPTHIRKASLTRFFAIADCDCPLCCSSPRRDELLRTIRCSTRGCSAPCGLTLDNLLASEFCPNGHRQQRNAMALTRFGATEGIFELQHYLGASERHAPIFGELFGSLRQTRRQMWQSLVAWWHPTNSNVWGARETWVAPSCRRFDDDAQPSFNRLGVESELAPFFVGMDEIVCVEWMLRHVPRIDRYQLLVRFEQALIGRLWGAPQDGRSPDDSVIAHRMLCEMRPLVEFYYGKEHAKSEAFRRCAAMTAQQFQSATIKWGARVYRSNSARRQREFGAS